MFLAQCPDNPSELPDYGTGHTLGEQSGRENQPQGRQSHPVAPRMLGRPFHAHRPRAEPFEQRQTDPDQQQQQQGILNQRKIKIVLENRMHIIREEDIYIQRDVFAFEIDQRFDPSDRNQQKPPQCERGMHIPQQFVGLPYFPVKQRLTDHFADRTENRPREKRPEKQTPFAWSESDEPADISIQQGNQQKDST